MTDITATALSIKMRALADTGHPQADLLRERADAFDLATHNNLHRPDGADGEALTKSMLGAWARARRTWSEAAGEALL